MTDKKKQNPPTLAMRFSDDDKRALLDLAACLDRSQTDTVRVLVRVAPQILPKLKKWAMYYPKPKPTGRPKGNQLAA
ncbi:MAG: hypothetical protein HYZ25_19175 [Chloroflexi bacterium]|nr:hypothetical protein [Chloroflexota bacterium]